MSPESAGYGRKFDQRIEPGSLRSAREIVPRIMSLVAPKSVIDVGCGTGSWLAAFLEAGVTNVLGVDHGIRATMRIPPERFREMDLCRPKPLGRRFDLGLSLEIAEHLAPQCAGDFVRFLTDLAPIVVFSAAIPFQGGTKHRNEQWPEYWAERFGKAGYRVADPFRRHIWNNPQVEWWYAQNMLLFIDNGSLQRFPCIAEEVAHCDPRRLSMVHPAAYLKEADPAAVSLKKMLRAAPMSFAQVVGRSLARMKPRSR